MYKNNIDFMEELDKFNQDHEKDKSKFKLILEDLPTGDYGYIGKTISGFEVKTKKRKVSVYIKEIDTEGKLF
jgi:phenylpyruvate tautomerase PptA (4-oxalocrotonate tautomerase family)